MVPVAGAGSVECNLPVDEFPNGRPLIPRAGTADVPKLPKLDVVPN